WKRQRLDTREQVNRLIRDEIAPHGAADVVSTVAIVVSVLLRDELEHLARGARFRRQLHLLDDRANLGLGRIGLAASSDDRSKRYETQQQVQACPAEGVAGTRTLGVAHARTIACGPSQ